MPPHTVVFDLGGVVLDWNPTHLYRQFFDDPTDLARFLDEVCTLEWHAQHDAGVPMAETIPPMVAAHPHLEGPIRAWRDRYLDMVSGTVDGTPEVIDELAAAGVGLYALSNMPAEVVDELRAAFGVLDRFSGIVVSGVERLVKPDPRLYRVLLDRFGLDAAATVFVDDVAANAAAARVVGMRAIRFVGATELRRDLVALGVLGA